MKRNAHFIERKETLRRSFIEGRVILTWILKKNGRKLWAGFIWLRRGTNCEVL
jgi:hypothetical protein